MEIQQFDEKKQGDGSENYLPVSGRKGKFEPYVKGRQIGNYYKKYVKRHDGRPPVFI
jgi:hypothetical protein